MTQATTCCALARLVLPVAVEATVASAAASTTAAMIRAFISAPCSGKLVRTTSARAEPCTLPVRMSRPIDRERRAPRRRQGRQVGDEAVPVATVDRMDELHDLTALRVRPPLEQERRRV